MIKVLVFGDAGCYSGFATAVHGIFDKLALRDDYEIHCLASNYRGDFWPTPMRLYVPTMLVPTDIFGMSRMVEMVGKIMPDVIVFVNDPPVILNMLLNNQHDPERALWRGIQMASGTIYRPPIITYLTCDGYDNPRHWDQLTERVTRVAMSRFGRDQMMPEAPVVWHGVDTSVYYPVPKKDAKRALGYDPDRFLVLRADANSFRKDYPSTWLALRPLLRKYKDIDVHWHTRPRSLDGYDLNALRYNDEDIRDRVNFSPNLDGFSGWPADAMRLLYSAADLFVSTAMSEGFGLNPLFAMACGTPVIAQDCTAITEVVGLGGALIPPLHRVPCPTGQWHCVADVDAFTREIEHLYLAGGVRRKLGRAAVEHAAQFSNDYAADAFDRIIRQSLGEEVRDSVLLDSGLTGVGP